MTEPADRPAPGSRWRHVQRGTVYTVLEQSTFQTSRSSRHEQDEFQALLRLAIGPSKDCTGCPRKDARQFCTDCRLATLLRGLDEPTPCKSLDDALVVTYQGEDGRRWTRPVEEFLDGRFVEVQEKERPSSERTEAMIEEVLRRLENGPLDPTKVAWEALERGLAPSEAGWVLRHTLHFPMPDAVHLAKIVEACRVEAGFGTPWRVPSADRDEKKENSGATATPSTDLYVLQAAKAIVRGHDSSWKFPKNEGTIRRVANAALVLLAALEESERHIASWKAEEADWAKDREELVEKLNQAEATFDRVRKVVNVLHKGAEDARRLALSKLLDGAGISAIAGSCLALDGAANLLEAALTATGRPTETSSST